MTMGKTPLHKRVLSCLLAVILVVGLMPTTTAFAEEEGSSDVSAREWRGFVDVQPSDWFATDDILGYAVDNGLISGYGNGLFGPYDNVTRAQVATILWRVAGEPTTDAEDFYDVDYSQWYGSAIKWARTSGVVSGYGDTNTFGPEDSVTREQLAVMLANYATEVAGIDATSDCTALDAIAGADGVSSWARTQMGWAVDEEILSGSIVDGIAWVDPQGAAQRCQAAKMVSVFHRDVLGAGNVIDYADDVVNAGETATVNDEGTSVTLPNAPSDITKGDVVVVDPTDDNPTGAAIYVQSVDYGDNGSAVVSGRQAELDEFVDELQISGSSTQLVYFEAADDVEIIDKATGAASARASFEDDATLADKTFKIGKYGTLDLDASVDYALDFGWGDIRLIELSIDASANFNWHYDTKVGKKDKKVGDALFWTSVPGVTIRAEFYVTYTATGEATIEAHASADAGVRYKNDKWKTWADKDFGASAAFEGTAQLAAEPSVALGFFGAGVVDASVEVGGMLEGGLYIRETGLICADLDAWLYVQMGVGQHNSLAHTLGLSKTFDLVDKSNGPRIKVHAENGKVVPECTWGKNPDSPSGDVTPTSDFEYVVLDGSEGVNEVSADSWNTNFTNSAWNPSNAYCGPGVYITKYVGKDSNIVVPRKIDGKPVKFVSLDWSDTGYTFDGAIDVSACADLEFLDANLGKLLGTDSLPSLRYLDARSNDLPHLSLSESDGIEYIVTGGNGISTVTGVVDLSGRQNLRYLDLVHHSGITNVNVSNCPQLTNLHCDAYKDKTITRITMDNVPNLKHLTCSGNSLTELDLSGKPNLVQLECANTRIGRLDVSGCPALEMLACWNTPITALDISGNPNLTSLHTSGCPLKDTSLLEQWAKDPSHYWDQEDLS